MSEICDDSNQARAFSFLGVTGGIGKLLGPALGGLLAQPAISYPSISWGIFETFPCARSSLVSSH